MPDLVESRTPDPAAYRQMLRLTFQDVRVGIARTARLLENADEPLDATAVDEFRRRVAALERIVAALAQAPEPSDPSLTGALQPAHVAALAAITQRLQNADTAGAVRLARHLVELLALELSWMPTP